MCNNSERAEQLRIKDICVNGLEGLGDYLFGDSCIKLGIRPFSEFKKEYEEAEKIKRSNEYKAYDIVKEILSSVITTNRLSLRMAQRHSSVLLDNKVNMAICRFYFMRKQKYMLIIDVKREQEKLLVNDVKDIYITMRINYVR